MTEDNTNNNLRSLSHLDDKRIEKLAYAGHYVSLLEEFEKLKLKFAYNKQMTKKEAARLVTLCKYFMRYAHNEPIQLSAQYFYERYIENYNL